MKHLFFNSLNFKTLPNKTLKITKPWHSVYEGEGDSTITVDGGDGDSTVAASGSAGDSTVTVDVNVPKFTQKQMNDILAREKGTWQKQTQTQIKQLEELRKSKSLTEKEKENLSTQIEDLNKSLLSKEELAKKERASMENKHKEEIGNVAKDRDNWKGRYTRETIDRTILDSAGANDGLEASQFVEILSPKSRLVEVLDSDGQSTGNWAPKVELHDTDKDGNPITLDLSITEAVKRMKDMPKYANLFKGTAAGGVGSSRAGTGTNRGSKDPANMSTEEYRKYRKENRHNR